MVCLRSVYYVCFVCVFALSCIVGLRWEIHPEALLSVVGEPAVRRRSLLGLLAPTAAPPRLRISRRVCAVSARPAVMGFPPAWSLPAAVAGRSACAFPRLPPFYQVIVFPDGSLSVLAVSGIAASACYFRGDQARRR